MAAFSDPGGPQTGLPWDDPRSDPLGDIREFTRRSREDPYPKMPKMIKVTSVRYHQIREIQHWAARFPAHPWDPWTTPLVVDDNLPAEPGYEVVWE